MDSEDPGKHPSIKEAERCQEEAGSEGPGKVAGSLLFGTLW